MAGWRRLASGIQLSAAYLAIRSNRILAAWRCGVALSIWPGCWLRENPKAQKTGAVSNMKAVSLAGINGCAMLGSTEKS